MRIYFRKCENKFEVFREEIWKYSVQFRNLRKESRKLHAFATFAKRNFRPSASLASLCEAHLNLTSNLCINILCNISMNLILRCDICTLLIIIHSQQLLWTTIWVILWYQKLTKIVVEIACIYVRFKKTITHNLMNVFKWISLII